MVGKADIVSMRKWNRDLAHVLYVRGNTVQPVWWIHNFRKMENMVRQIHNPILFIIKLRKLACKNAFFSEKQLVIPGSVKTWLTLEKLHKSYHSIEHPDPHMQSARTVRLKLLWSLNWIFANVTIVKSFSMQEINCRLDPESHAYSRTRGHKLDSSLRWSLF